ncbi:MAG: membrane integrity-associated transporter subunit PqiC [Alphaproteobacteria bacterium]|nr:membrane integrity-associated transporter subunit PqiC [Alphaproteobacteria bacterium]
MTALLGCTSLIPGTTPAPQLYVLTRKSTFPPDLPTVTQQLLVDVPFAPAQIDTTRVALSRSPTTLDYFADAAWGDRAPVMVQGLFIESFEQTRKIVGVSRDEAGLRADYVLMGELRHFEAVYPPSSGTADSPPTVYVQILVRLVRMPERVIIGETIAERREAAARNAMEAIVEAYNDALGGVMKDIVSWTLLQMSRDAAVPRPRP